MQDKVDILGVHVDRLTMSEAVEKVCGFFQEDRPHAVFTPNSEIIMKAYRDDSFRDLLNQADLLTPDGIGVVKAAAILKRPIAERVAGFDMINQVFDRIKNQPVTVFLLGSKPGVAERAKQEIEKLYPGIQIVGTHNGYFQDDGPVIKEINRVSPDFLLVCLGAPRQEKWIADNLNKLSAKVCIGAGGTLDVFAGTVKRAPQFYIDHHAEWLYRLLCQPQRFFRMLDLPKFALTVMVKGKRQKNTD